MRFNRPLRNSLFYLLILFLIFPASPHLFKSLINLKEPSYICPLYTRESWCVRSDSMGDGSFGARRSGGKRRHKGLDIEGSLREPVAASKSGIARTGEVPRGMGKYVKITHPDGSVTIYGHLSSVAVADRSWVRQGQKIGELGKTGNACYPGINPHLHFEVRVGGEAVDPYPLISRQK